MFLYYTFWRTENISFDTCLKILSKSKKLKTVFLSENFPHFSFNSFSDSSWEASFLYELQLLFQLPIQFLGNDTVPVKLFGASFCPVSTSSYNAFASAISVSRKSHSAYETSLFWEMSNRKLPMASKCFQLKKRQSADQQAPPLQLSCSSSERTLCKILTLLLTL